MKRLRSLGLIFLLGFVPFNNEYSNLDFVNEPSEATSLQELEPKELIYKNFTEIDFNEFDGEEADRVYGKRIDRYSYSPRIKNIKKLEEMVFRAANESNKDIGHLSIKEALEFGINLVSKKINWTDVDSDSILRCLPIEEYLEMGKGDCDKYSIISAVNN